MTNANVKIQNPDDPNVRDPAHAHELGGTLGMTVGGVAGGIGAGTAAVVGAGAGSIAGPVGIIAGAAIGGAIGGALGEGIARKVNPTLEEQYWEKNYQTRPYVVTEYDFESYRPAYRAGIESYTSNPKDTFDAVEPKLRDRWMQTRGDSELEWNDARFAARDAFDRLSTSERR